MAKVTQEQLDAALDKYRQAMAVRWIHPSQDEAARHLAFVYSLWRRQTDPKPGARAPAVDPFSLPDEDVP